MISKNEFWTTVRWVFTAILLIAIGILVYDAAKAQTPVVSGTTYDYETKWFYSGDVVTVGWCHDDLTVTFDVEIREFPSNIMLASATDITQQLWQWQISKSGHFIARVRAVNSEGASAWVETHMQETDPGGPQLGCPQTTPRNFFIYADIAPPSGGGIE